MNNVPSNLHYAMELLWEPHDEIFVVTIPEFRGCKTHGETYVEAVKQGIEVMGLCHDVEQDRGRDIPRPYCFGDSPLQRALNTNDIEHISPAGNQAAMPPYSLMIQWDDRAATFVAHVPELEYVAAQGSSYEEVASKAGDSIASRVFAMRSKGESLPPVNTYSLSLVTANA